MNVAIRNYVAGSFLLESEPHSWDAIVILDSRTRATDFVANYALRHMTLTFDDVSRELPGKRAPMLTDVRSAIEFAATSDKLPVCCRAGQSRSAAIAFSIAYGRGLHDPDFVLDPRRHEPNKRVIQLAATALSDPTILSAYDSWKLSNQQIRLSDYFDEIERELDTIEALGARNRIVA